MSTVIESFKAEDVVAIQEATQDRLSSGWLLLTSYVDRSRPMYVYFIWYQ